jgi:Fe-S-cluster containining protein
MGVVERKKAKGLWNNIRNVECKGLCQESCGPISMTYAEAQIIRRAMPNRELPVFNKEKAQCSFLGEDGKCRGYEVRPLVCRLYGSIPALQCEHGCEPVLTNKQGNLFMSSMINISRGRERYDSDPELLPRLMKERGIIDDEDDSSAQGNEE